jgi:hypothetical protein
MSFRLEPLPSSIRLETAEVLLQLAKSHRRLAELNGAAATIRSSSPRSNAVPDH